MEFISQHFQVFIKLIQFCTLNFLNCQVSCKYFLETYVWNKYIKIILQQQDKHYSQFTNQQKMLETTSNISAKQNQSQDIGAHHQFSLPLINKNKIKTQQQIQSEHDSQSHDKFQYNNKHEFPQIRKSRATPVSPQSMLRKADYFKKNKKEFAKQVKQKLDLVLGEMPEAGQIAQDEGYGSDDFDFQAKINKNKQLIKLHRLKKQSQNLSSSQAKQKQKQKESKTKKQTKNRNQSLYEKRVKQYQDQSNQNKYLQKKKQFIKQKQKSNNIEKNQFVGESMKDLKLREEYGSVKNDRIQLKKSQGKKSPARVLSQKSPQKQIFQMKQTANLFDGIQNFLQNPHENIKKQAKKPLIGLTLLKAKRDLEDKIKAINEKLGITSNQQTSRKSQTPKLKMDTTARQWTRVQIKQEKIQSTYSNFQKEIEKVGLLQQKNAQCLEKYLQHQKILLQLQLRRMQLPRKDHANSH